MTAHRFMFATGIENSYPTIQNGSVRVDEMEAGGHYKHWETDFALLQELGIRFLRYGPPIHRTWLGQGRYDWEFADQTFGAEAPRHHADRRPVPLRRARLDRQLPEPGLPGAVRRVRPRLRRALSLGAALHAGERDVHLRHLLGRYGWWNEQLAATRPSSPRSSTSSRPTCWRCTRSSTFARRALHPERILRVLPCRRAGRDLAGGDSERRALPIARPQLRPARRLRDVRVPDGQRHDAGTSTTSSSTST